MSRLRLLVPGLILAGMALIAGCGGNSNGSLFINPPATPTPTIGPTPQVISITGAGYTLTFTLPSVTVGSSGTVSAALQAAPPVGIPTPQARMRSQIGGNAKALVYLTVSSTAKVGFSSLPSFLWQLPSASVIPAGQYGYMAWYDPYVGQWVAQLGPGSQSGSSLAFQGVSGGLTLNANTKYVYALVTTTAVVPTAPPAPTPTPTPTPVPVPTFTPGAQPPQCSAGPANTFPMGIANNTGITSKMLVVLYGLDPGGSGTWYYATDPSSGATAQLPAAGSPMPTFTMPPSGCINLPPFISGRMYFYFQTDATGASALKSNGPAGGVSPPSNNSSAFPGDLNNVWDFVEYTWTPAKTGSTAFFIDVTAVDQIGIPVSFWLSNNGVKQNGPYGFPSGAGSSIASKLQTLGPPWSNIIETTTTSGTGGVFKRVVSPKDAFGASNGISFDTSYWNPVLQATWNAYTPATGQILHLNYPQFGDAYGQSNGAGTPFVFYANAQLTGSPTATINYPTSAFDVFGSTGVFKPCNQCSGDYIGRALDVSIERGTLPVPATLPANWPPASDLQPFCGLSDWKIFYGGLLNGVSVPSTTTMDWYAGYAHYYAYAPNAGLPGLIYGFADDDECSLPNGNGAGQYEAATSRVYQSGDQWSVVLNPY